VVKASWGIKRTCQNCAARFYDLNKSPIKCPKCGREHDREDFVKVRRGRASAAATAATAAAAAAAAKLALAKNKKVEDGALAEYVQNYIILHVAFTFTYWRDLT